MGWRGYQRGRTGDLHACYHRHIYILIHLFAYLFTHLFALLFTNLSTPHMFTSSHPPFIHPHIGSPPLQVDPMDMVPTHVGADGLHEVDQDTSGRDQLIEQGIRSIVDTWVKMSEGGTAEDGGTTILYHFHLYYIISPLFNPLYFTTPSTPPPCDSLFTPPHHSPQYHTVHHTSTHYPLIQAPSLTTVYWNKCLGAMPIQPSSTSLNVN